MEHFFVPFKAAGGKRLLSYAVKFTEVVFAKTAVSLCSMGFLRCRKTRGFLGKNHYS